MLFIDTFARSAVGLDENDATQVGLWIDGITALQHEMETDVVAIHHAQKAKADGYDSTGGHGECSLRLERYPISQR